jgi:WXG100 family type VII secretion target
MSAPIVQSDYEAMDAIARRFQQQNQRAAALKQRVDRGVTALRSGGWQGEGSAAFVREMESEVNPATQRLIDALAEAQQVTLQVKALIRQAEEEAASVFRGEGKDGNINGGSGSGEGPFVVPVPPGNVVGFMPNAKPSDALIVKKPKEVFSESYMEKFIGVHYRGEDSQQLNQLMEDLLTANPSDQQRMNNLLERIADVRGVDHDTFRAQYQTYLNLKQNAQSNGTVDAIDLGKHGDFLGSTASLRYGAVVGDIFGIDPIFGSLLNPTGGLVGAGNASYEPGDNDAIGYHGIFHDAAGYLFNYHDKLGPGYNYLGREPFPTSNPLTGQIGGISWWASHPGLDVDVLPHIMPDIPYVPAFAERFIANVIEDPLIAVIREDVYMIEHGVKIVDSIGDIFSGDFREGAETIADGIGQLFEGTVNNTIESTLGSTVVGGVRDLADQLFG